MCQEQNESNAKGTTHLLQPDLERPKVTQSIFSMHSGVKPKKELNPLYQSPLPPAPARC